MDGRKRIYGLDLDDHQACDQEINPISQIKLGPLIDDREANLSQRLIARLTKFILQARRVRALQQPGAEFTVNSHGPSYDCVADLVRAYWPNLRGRHEQILFD